jgi:3-oxoacyl-[acyl-carrier protein] reductase
MPAMGVTGSLEGRTAIVSGAGRGIGRATALALAERGAAVVVNDVGAATGGDGRDAEVAAAVAAEIVAAGGRAVANTGSVAEIAGAEDLVRTAHDAFGSVDILVNNAGAMVRGAIWEVDPATFERVVATHLRGAYLCTHFAAPHMMERRWGRIVNLVSRAGITGIAGNVAYGSGKGGVFGLTNVCARDLGPHGVTVNGVNPASTDTRMVREAIETMRGSEDAEHRRVADALEKATQPPERVAEVIAALCTERAGEINGEFFLVQGDEVGLFEPLRVERGVTREPHWGVDELAAALAALEGHPLEGPY